MKELWISVSARISEKDVVWRAVEFLGISEDTAVACLVRFWGGVAAHADGGDLRDKSDAQIEKWAGWKGEPGDFARYVKEHCLSDGILKHWDETHGKLEDRKRKDRARKIPRKDDGDSAEIPPVSTPTLPNPLTTTSSSSTPREEPEPEKPPSPKPDTDKQRQAMLARFEFDDSGTIAEFLDAVDPPRRTAWVGKLDMWSQGYDLPPAPPAVKPPDIAHGIGDYMAGEQNRSFNVNRVKGYVVSAARARENPPETGSGPPNGSHPRGRPSLMQRNIQHAIDAASLPPLPGDG